MKDRDHKTPAGILIVSLGILLASVLYGQDTSSKSKDIKPQERYYAQIEKGTVITLTTKTNADFRLTWQCAVNRQIRQEEVEGKVSSDKPKTFRPPDDWGCSSTQLFIENKGPDTISAASARQ
jgi:hypothetical protein